MDVFPLEFAPFRAWLESRGAMEEIGKVGGYRDCPIARYVSQLTGKKYGVAWNERGAFLTVCREGFTCEDQTLPPWVHRFLKGVDIGLPAVANGFDERRVVRAGRALWLLDGLFPELVLELAERADDNLIEGGPENA